MGAQFSRIGDGLSAFRAFLEHLIERPPNSTSGIVGLSAVETGESTSVASQTSLPDARNSRPIGLVSDSRHEQVVSENLGKTRTKWPSTAGSFRCREAVFVTNAPSAQTFTIREFSIGRELLARCKHDVPLDGGLSGRSWKEFTVFCRPNPLATPHIPCTRSRNNAQGCVAGV